jgi:hypothetical protein
MKLITMFSKREYVVNDDEADNVAIASQKDGMIKLRSGDYINPKAIESIGEPAEIAFYKGYLVNKDGRTFTRDGQRITIESPENIKYLPDPKYQITDNMLTLPE